MDSPSTTTEAKHQYPQQWQQSQSKPTVSRTAPGTPAADFPATFFPQHLDLQSLYQVHLNFYNELISPGRGGGGGPHSSPFPPAASSPRTHHTSRSRSSSKSSKVSNRDNQHTKPGTQSCHGNRPAKSTETAERANITPVKELPVKMSAKKHLDTGHPPSSLPLRPPPHTATGPTSAPGPTSDPSSSASVPIATLGASIANSLAQSSSVPSTPHQHARKFSFESREPSPNATQNHSPRSAYSETNGNVPSLRPLPPRLVGGCRYETAVPHSRRRMPYSIGTEKLEKVGRDKIKDKLPDDVEKKLTTDMRELYDRLLPTEEIEKHRQKLVQKLEKLFNEEWPGHDIRVHLFGSSGNLLCTDDSDVDMCITTDWKELEGVCMIAELLARHGMEKVVCVKSAKVPIVKIWDPELGLACDMNVNNSAALENTRLIRTYVEIDPRVRELAMIIKYWTRQRIVNDAAFGGTLSSYTWICLIIAFLQLRDPPVLPALHQRHKEKTVKQDGRKSEFGDDLNKLRGFGEKNKSSLGDLLFQFFKFYAHEFDYDTHVLSVRHGKLLTKTEKRWHFGVNNMLCVEEPFNTIRNLGNTADDTSFRGLHLELRRAYDLISEGKFDECCEEYVFPKEEERIWQKPAAAPRPVLVRSSSQQHSGRGGRNNYRGGRQFNRNNNSRRASSSVAYDNTQAAYAQLPAALSPQDLLWYHQAAQNPLSLPQDLLAPTLNALAAHETQLRFQLYTQAQQMNQQQALAHAQRMQGGGVQPQPQHQTPTDRSRTNSFDTPPLSAPIRPEMLYQASYGYALQGPPYFAAPGFPTYPPSPASTTATGTSAGAAGEFRRSLHRNAVDAGAAAGSGALRSQSQPASRTPMPTVAPNSPFPAPTHPLGVAPVFPPRQVNGIPIPSFMPDEHADSEFDDAPTKPVSDSPTDEGPRYVGYYVTEASSPIRKANTLPNGVPSFGDLVPGAQRRRLSTDHTPQSILDRRMKRTSRSPSPLGHARAFSVGTSSAPLSSAPFPSAPSKLASPLVVNGSATKPSPAQGSGRQPSRVMTTDDHTYDNPLHITQGPSAWTNQAKAQVLTSAAIESNPPVSDRPLVVNGSTAPVPAPAPAPASASASASTSTSVSHSPVTVAPTMPDLASFQQRLMASSLNQMPYTPLAHVPGVTGARPRVNSRSSQNGIAPLDLATSDFGTQTLQNLSPVYENRTPSPSAVRKFEAPPVLASSKVGATKDQTTSRPAQKTPPVKTPPTQSSAKQENSNKSPTSDPRANGIARESGQARTTKSPESASSGWTKQKSRKKALSGDLRTTTNGVSHIEQLPKNDADRKGG
ncbi:hypothetical protein GQ53DRAFT_351022 [Thozetella sp. PMI_491]|nr:hypothetical protein GQ53DRAFT_351022 [Thozetella sp. PMI_491]